MTDLTDRKTCQYKPCSRTFRRVKGDKQWPKRQYCNCNCQQRENARQATIKRKAQLPNANFHQRSAPQFLNPKFWDKILMMKLKHG